jgi:hypothetical protein
MNIENAVEIFRMRENRKHQTSMLCSSHDEEFKKRETEFLGYQATGNQKTLKVGIFSPDRFIRDFLQGILTFQGYQCIDAQEGQDVFWNMTPHPGQVVFLDGLYLLGHESEAARHRVQEFAQAGMKVMVLVDRRWDADLAPKWKVAGCRIVWKPLDYWQVGQVMAQM